MKKIGQLSEDKPIYYQDLSSDTFVHFTTLQKAKEIIASGKLLMNPPYDKIGIDAVCAVSLTFGTNVPNVQQSGKPNMVAIIFKTDTVPSYGVQEEVVWHQDVNLIDPKVIMVSKALSLLKPRGYYGEDIDPEFTYKENDTEYKNYLSKPLSESVDIKDKVIQDIITSHTIPELVMYDWDKIAFGFSSGDKLTIPVNQINIKYKEDMLNTKTDMSKYFKGSKLSELPPVEVSYTNKKFYLEDGHHRYSYAKQQGIKQIDAIVEIKDNPFKYLGFDIDDLAKEKKSMKNINESTNQLFESFIDSFKTKDNIALIESIKNGFVLLFENESGNKIVHSTNERHGFKEISIVDTNNNELSKLTYSENPVTSYTIGKNREDYVNIEWLETPAIYRKKGYGSVLLKELKNKYPNKKIIANPNDLSQNITDKHDIIDTNLTESIINGLLFENSSKYSIDDDYNLYVDGVREYASTSKKDLVQYLQKTKPDLLKTLNLDPINKPKELSGIITLYRGIGPSEGNNYYTPDKEFAMQFTQSGLESQIRKVKVNTNRIYRHDPLPKAYGQEDPNFDKAIEIAKSKGMNSIWADEGSNQPNSVFKINPNSPF